jgi:hypothetical protein
MAFAEQTGGTADEARAMLIKAVAAVRADEAKALDMFNKGEGGFRDRDLYVFYVSTSDGTIVATGNPNLKQALGVDIRTAQNSTGRPFGVENLCGDSEAGQSNHRGQLYGPKARRR